MRSATAARGPAVGFARTLGTGAHILVTGARVTGRAIVAALDSWDVAISVCDDDAAAARALGDHIARQTRSPASASLIWWSPARAFRHPLRCWPRRPKRAFRSGVTWNWPGAGRHRPLWPARRWLVVTGTNGKPDHLDAAPDAACG